MSSQKSALLRLLSKWDDGEDGDPVECMVGVEYELQTFIDRLEDSGAEGLVPALEEVFDAVLNESDEACTSIVKVGTHRARRSARVLSWY